MTFFKRDELTTDLICCDIEGRERGWFFHEEAEGWGNLLRHASDVGTIYEAVTHPTMRLDGVKSPDK